MRKKAFTITSLLICLSMISILVSGIYVMLREESPEYVAKQDMDRLARWLNSAFLRADRWKCRFYLIIYPKREGPGSFMSLTWIDLNGSELEFFYADSRVCWQFLSSKQDFEYRWQSRTLTPAFSIAALDSDGNLVGESLTVSVRALVTRESS